MKFLKGDIIMICENGEPTNMSTNLDIDRDLEIGDIFDWLPNKKWQPIKMKVLSINFPLTVEELN